MKVLVKACMISVIVFLAISSIVACSNSAPEPQNNNLPVQPAADDSESAQNSQLEEKVPLTIEQVEKQLVNSQYLDKTHINIGAACVDCHPGLEDGEASPPSDEVCLACHGSYDDLANLLQEKEQWQTYNPHYAHEQDDCITCHKVHQPFELTCSGCHSVKAPERFK